MTQARLEKSDTKKQSRFSPLTRRRWANFRANKRGYWALRIFLVLFAITMVSEFIANDRPLLIRQRPAPVCVVQIVRPILEEDADRLAFRLSDQRGIDVAARPSSRGNVRLCTGGRTISIGRSHRPLIHGAGSD